MASVWWVEAGEYSDWHVKAIFSTKEKAEEYVRVYNASCPKDKHLKADSIKEQLLDAPIGENIGEWMVHISVRGTATKEYGAGQWLESGFGDFTTSWHQRQEWNGIEWIKKDEPIFVGIGKTREHARRSAEDLRREYIVAHGNKFVPMPEEDLHG